MRGQGVCDHSFGCSGGGGLGLVPDAGSAHAPLCGPGGPFHPRTLSSEGGERCRACFISLVRRGGHLVAISTFRQWPEVEALLRCTACQHATLAEVGAGIWWLAAPFVFHLRKASRALELTSTAHTALWQDFQAVLVSATPRALTTHALIRSYATEVVISVRIERLSRLGAVPDCDGARQALGALRATLVRSSLHFVMCVSKLLLLGRTRLDCMRRARPVNVHPVVWRPWTR